MGKKSHKQAVSEEDADIDDVDNHPPNATSSRPARGSKPSAKQAQINANKESKLESQLKSYQKKYQRLKNKAARREERRNKRDNDYDSASADSDSSMGPESEDEPEDVADARRHQSSFESRGIFEAELPAAKRLRRGSKKARAGEAPTQASSTRAPSPYQSQTAMVFPGEVPSHEHQDRSRILPQQVNTSSSPQASPPHAPIPPYHRPTPQLALVPMYYYADRPRTPPGHSPFTLQEPNLPPPYIPQIEPLRRSHSSSSHHSAQSSMGRTPVSSPPPSERDDSQTRSSVHRSSSPHSYGHQPRHSETANSHAVVRYDSSSRPDTRGRTGYSKATSVGAQVQHSEPQHHAPETQAALVLSTSDLPCAVATGPTSIDKDPPYLNGRTPSGKPKAGDYEHHVNKLIVLACHRYGVFIVTENPFPPDETQDLWAVRAWAETCSGAQLQYRCTDSIQKIITSRGSHARGTLRDKIRPTITASYGFTDNGTERAKATNLERYTYLLDRDGAPPEPTFHYKDPEKRTGFAHNSVVLSAIKNEWFAEPSSAGVKYMSDFAPIREVTLALVFTAIEYCLDQWADGTFNKHLHFSEKLYKPKYDTYLKQVQDWCSTDLDASRIVRQRLYDRARRASGAPPPVAPAMGLTEASRDRLRLELAAAVAARDDDED